MKSHIKSKFPYLPFKTYCTRTPLLSVNHYLSLMAFDEIPDAELKRQLQISEIAEAIYLASPELYQQLIKWGNGEIKDEKRAKRLKVTLLKYLARMSTRCTPFGLFATIGTGVLSNETKIELEHISRFKKRSHYDMHFLAELANSLISKPKIKKQLGYFTNTSLYKIGARYRYIEYIYQNKRRFYSLESISHSKYLETILNSSKSGITIPALVAKLEKLGVEPKEAKRFIDELIANQILVSELEPSITGPDFLEDIRNRLERLSNVNNEIKKIEDLQFLIAQLDKNIANPIESYLPIMKLISELEIPFDHKYLIQTDVFSTYKTNSISNVTLKKIKQGITFLNRISKPEQNKNLERFKTEFIKRYDHAKMPLLEVMDVEMGIGYIQNPNSLETTPFLNDIVYLKDNEKEPISVISTPLQTVLIKKLNEAFSKNESKIELTDADFTDETYNWDHAPDTLSVMIEIVLEDGNEKILMDYCGSHASRLLGRFGHGNNSIGSLLKEIMAKESQINPDSLMAEIVHIPESRTGNIMRRLHLRDFEIPYLGKSNLPINQQIQLEDIFVTVEQGTIKLFKKGSNKPIMPYSSNAHNYSNNSLPIYHFLCDLQSQKQKGFGFNWGSVFTIHTFLPRVVYKDCILSPAQWMLNKHDIILLTKHYDSKQESLKALDTWKKNQNIPNLVQLVDGDNTLPINFKNYNSVEMFLEIIKHKETFKLEEFLGKGDSVVKSSSKNYCNQFIFAFFNDTKLRHVQNN